MSATAPAAHDATIATNHEYGPLAPSSALGDRATFMAKRLVIPVIKAMLVVNVVSTISNLMSWLR